MPFYRYLNTETGEEWEDFRPISRMEDGVDGIKIKLLINGCPPIADRSLSTKKGQDFYDKVIAPKKKYHPGLK